MTNEGILTEFQRGSCGDKKGNLFYNIGHNFATRVTVVDHHQLFYLKRQQESFCGIQSSGFKWQNSKAHLSREYLRSLRGSLSAALTKFLKARNLHCSEHRLGEL